MIESIALATLGGALIGAAASLLLLTHGKIAGISGILGGLIQRKSTGRAWRGLFVAGLITGGVVLVWASPDMVVEPSTRSLGTVAAAGLLVGLGTRLGNGCTSGHGVCGLSRFSARSLVATLTFLATGFLTATIIQIAFGGAL